MKIFSVHFRNIAAELITSSYLKHWFLVVSKPPQRKSIAVPCTHSNVAAYYQNAIQLTPFRLIDRQDNTFVLSSMLDCLGSLDIFGGSLFN